jgi:hypothetical protein
MEAKDVIVILIAGAALALALVALVLVHRLTRYAFSSATYAALLGRLLAVNRLAIEKPELFRGLYADRDEGGKGESDAALGLYVFMTFALYADVYTQHTKYGLITGPQLRTWERLLENEFQRRPYLRGYWRAESERFAEDYTPGFRQFVTAALERAERRLRSYGTLS